MKFLSLSFYYPDNFLRKMFKYIFTTFVLCSSSAYAYRSLRFLCPCSRIWNENNCTENQVLNEIYRYIWHELLKFSIFRHRFILYNLHYFLVTGSQGKFEECPKYLLKRKQRIRRVEFLEVVLKDLMLATFYLPQIPFSSMVHFKSFAFLCFF